MSCSSRRKASVVPPRTSPHSLAAGIALALSSLVCAGNAQALDFHVSGEQIIASGDVASGDLATLADLYARATAAGKTISTVVFRNSPGGLAVEGTGMAQFIRANGLDTAFQGGCYSACAMAFTGGVERHLTEFDLPSYGLYTKTELGYHGASLGGVPVSTPQQQPYIDLIARLLGPEGAVAMPRIRQAHEQLQDSQGFLTYHDPATGEPTRFCPTGDWQLGDYSLCTVYEDVTIRSDTIVNTEGYLALDDTLNVTSAVSGDINPNYGLSRPSIEDAYGIVRVRQGGSWALDTLSSNFMTWVDGGTLTLVDGGAVLGAERIFADNGGTVSMRGGLLASRTTIMEDATLEGYGATGTIANVFGTFAPSDFHVLPTFYSDAYDNDGSLGLIESSTAVFDVTAQTTTPAVTLWEMQTWTLNDIGFAYLIFPETSRGQMRIYDGSTLALNVATGFYRGGQAIPLVGTAVDSSVIDDPGQGLCTDYSFVYCFGFGELGDPATVPFIEGRFQYVVSAADAGTRIDLSTLDASQQVFHPFRNSLLSFNVVQTDDAITLVANPAFEDTSIFAGSRAGAGLGEALRTASYQEGTPLAPLLGALQFADADVARSQAGALRGDGHASLRSTDLALAGQFGDVLDQHRLSVRGTGGDRANAATALSPASFGNGLNANGIAAALPGIVRYLADGPAEDAAGSAGDTRFWVRGFGRTGHSDRQGDVARMNYNASGLMLGADRRSEAGNLLFGAALGFGSMSAKQGGFHADVDAIDASAYLDWDYGRGFVAASARYTDLDHDTRRRIDGIDGLEAPNRASYGGDAVSLGLEHALSFTTAGGATWQPLLPVVDYVKLSDEHIREKAGGSAPLQGRLDAYESLRGGVGIQVFKSYRTANGETWTPHAKLLWQHEFRDREGVFRPAFSADPSLGFLAVGQDAGSSFVKWNLGLTSHASERLSVLIDYVGERSARQVQHGIAMGLSYRF